MTKRKPGRPKGTTKTPTIRKRIPMTLEKIIDDIISLFKTNK